MYDNYRADDREPEDEPFDPQATVPTNIDTAFRAIRQGKPDAAALILMWASRDANYAALPRALSDSQIAAIKAWRMKEVNELAVAERSKIAMRVLSWWPPMHGQGTGDDSGSNRPGLAGWAGE